MGEGEWETRAEAARVSVDGEGGEAAGGGAGGVSGVCRCGWRHFGSGDMSGDSDEMKALMVHVERIVRPVRASARRKLRMRRELLVHLQSAVEQERLAAEE